MLLFLGKSMSIRRSKIATFLGILVVWCGLNQGVLLLSTTTSSSQLNNRQPQFKKKHHRKCVAVEDIKKIMALFSLVKPLETPSVEHDGGVSTKLAAEALWTVDLNSFKFKDLCSEASLRDQVLSVDCEKGTPSAGPAFVAPVVGISPKGTRIQFETQAFVHEQFLSDGWSQRENADWNRQHFYLDIISLPSKRPINWLKRVLLAVHNLSYAMTTKKCIAPRRWFFWVDSTITKLHLRTPDASNPDKFQDHLITNVDEVLRQLASKSALNVQEVTENTADCRARHAAAPCTACTTDERLYFAVRLSRLLVDLASHAGILERDIPNVSSISPDFYDARLNALSALLSENTCKVSKVKWLTLIKAEENVFSVAYVQHSPAQKQYRIIFINSEIKGMDKHVVCTFKQTKQWTSQAYTIQRVQTYRYTRFRVQKPRASVNLSYELMRIAGATYSEAARVGTLDRWSFRIPSYATAADTDNNAFTIDNEDSCLEEWPTLQRALRPPSQQKNHFETELSVLWAIRQQRIHFFEESINSGQETPKHNKRLPNDDPDRILYAPVIGIRNFVDRVEFTAGIFVQTRFQTLSDYEKHFSKAGTQGSTVSKLRNVFSLDIVTLPQNEPLNAIKEFLLTISILERQMPHKRKDRRITWYFWIDTKTTKIYLHCSCKKFSTNSHEDYLIADANESFKMWADPLPEAETRRLAEGTADWRRYCAAAPCKNCETDERAYYAIRFSQELVRLEVIYNPTDTLSLKKADRRPTFQSKKVRQLMSMLNHKCKVTEGRWESPFQSTKHAFCLTYLQELYPSYYRAIFFDCSTREKVEVLVCTFVVMKPKLFPKLKHGQSPIQRILAKGHLRVVSRKSTFNNDVSLVEIVDANDA